MEAKMYKIYEWGTVGQGQEGYGTIDEAVIDLCEYLPSETPATRQGRKIELIPVVLTGYLVEGTAFFVSAERDDRPANELLMRLDLAQGLIDDLCA